MTGIGGVRLGGIWRIDGKDVRLWGGGCAEGLLEFLDDLGVGDAVEEHFVELIADFFGEPGDFAATGAGGRREWIGRVSSVECRGGCGRGSSVGCRGDAGFLGLWIVEDIGGGCRFVVFCGHRFCVCGLVIGEIAVAHGCGQTSTECSC